MIAGRGFGGGSIVLVLVLDFNRDRSVDPEINPDGTKNLFASTLGFTTASGLACDRSGNVSVSSDHSS